MRLSIDLELPGLGDALAATVLRDVPVEPTSLALTATSMRIEGKAMGFKSVALTARVELADGTLRIRGFDVEGALGFKATVLAALRVRLAKLDERSGPFWLRGSADGDELSARWA